MKVLHIVTGLTKANGVSVFLCELAAEQVSLGHDVSILVKSLGDDVYPIDSTILPESNLFHAGDWHKLKDLLEGDVERAGIGPWTAKSAAEVLLTQRWGGSAS